MMALPVLTVNVAILSCGSDTLPLDLDVFPTGAAVELVDPDLSPAQLVRHCALRPHILLKIRRRVILPLFMQKGKIKYIIVLLVWDRKLQLRVSSPSQQVSPAPSYLRVAPQHEKMDGSAKQRNWVRKSHQELLEQSASSACAQLTCTRSAGLFPA